MHPLFNSTILRAFDGEIPCKPFISVLYYKRCKKNTHAVFSEGA